jgi:tRNA-2-methylthio-N6-dimethylallyladenosine synthase
LPSFKKIFTETYGCQMNFADTDIVVSILKDYDYITTSNIADADVIFLNTCSIRDHAEQRVLNRLQAIRSLKKKKPKLLIGVLGCMAERLKEELLKERNFIDLIVGPDAYRDLPHLLEVASSGQKGINVLLSAEETYGDIHPVRTNPDKITAFISIMRGCVNYCSYCVVPYTRGKERSRDPKTIVAEAKDLFNSGYREVTLLGQNVNSYSWTQDGTEINFTALLENVAQIHPELRVRFATSHPKDLPDELLYTIARNENICRCIHLPLQSGSNRILKLMNRKYTREYYLNRIEAIHKIIPDCSITTDIIAGFCTETEEDHQATLLLMKTAGFDYAFMFKYSERPGTPAAEKLQDDVPEEIKSRRLKEIIDLQQTLSLKNNKKDIGKTFNVLIEKYSKRSANFLSGRNSQNKMVVFPAADRVPGQYADVLIKRCTAATLIGELV